MIYTRDGRHDAYLDGERVPAWTAADPERGWIDVVPPGAEATRREGRVELVDLLTGRVTRAERDAAVKPREG